MLAQFRRFTEKLCLSVLDEQESVALRKYFRKRYNIHIGLYSYGCFDQWRIAPLTYIGRYCSLARTCRIINRNHPMYALTHHPMLYDPTFGIVESDPLPKSSPTIIEDDVWIGHNVVIAPGCKLVGRGAIVGAGSVVTHDVTRYSIVAGVPAKKIRPRFASKLAEKIEASRWWEMDKTQLATLVKTSPETVFSPTAESIETWRLTREQ